MKRLFDPCAQYLESISLLASGALPAAERPQIERHLAECADCQQYFDELNRVAAPLACWEDGFEQIKPSEAARLRWAREIKTAKAPQPSQPLAAKSSPRVLWFALIWPYRRTWTGMAVVWLAMLWINFGQSAYRPATLEARAKPAEVWQTFAEQRRLLAELVPAASQPSEKSRREPRPRSERRNSWDSAGSSGDRSTFIAAVVLPRAESVPNS